MGTVGWGGRRWEGKGEGGKGGVSSGFGCVARILNNLLVRPRVNHARHLVS